MMPESTWWDAFLLRRRACWETRLSLDEAAERLSDRTQPYGLAMSASPDEAMPWIGSAQRSTFELELVRTLNNAFRPIAQGTLAARGPRARVTVELAPRMFARLFVLAPLGLAVLGAAIARDPAALGLAMAVPMFWLFGQLFFRIDAG